MFQPGFGRGVLGLILGMIIGAAIISLIRLVMGEPFSSGSAIFFAAFGGLFGWLWGIGSFHKYSHDHHGIEHAITENAPNPLGMTAERVRKSMPGIMTTVRPLIQPLLIASAIALVIVAIFFIGGSLLGREQTYNQAADAKNITAALSLSDQLKVNKAVIFIVVVVVVMGILGGLALVIALLMNGLSQQVEVAKKAPANPAQTEPTAFRLIDFFVSWIGDILEGTKHSMNR